MIPVMDPRFLIYGFSPHLLPSFATHLGIDLRGVETLNLKWVEPPDEGMIPFSLEAGDGKGKKRGVFGWVVLSSSKGGRY